jgi:hypothetical protein
MSSNRDTRLALLRIETLEGRIVPSNTFPPTSSLPPHARAVISRDSAMLARDFSTAQRTLNHDAHHNNATQLLTAVTREISAFTSQVSTITCPDRPCRLLTSKSDPDIQQSILSRDLHLLFIVRFSTMHSRPLIE